MKSSRGRIRIWLADVAALYVFWLLCTGNTSSHELYVGAGAAALAATGADAVRGLGFARFRPRIRWLLLAWRIPGMIAKGCWMLLKALVARVILRREIQGEMITVPFRPGGRDARSAARRALAVLFTTAAPNSIVLRIDPKEKLLLYHQVLGTSLPEVTKRLGAQP